MSGYRRVNYYELCRLCTSSGGKKIHLFRGEGRRRQIPTKIQNCLSLQVNEYDSLPKNICYYCAKKLESMNTFREMCLNAGNMLEQFFSSIKYSDDFVRDGMVYIRDESPKRPNLDDDVDEPLAIGETDANQSQASSVSVTTIKVTSIPDSQIINSTHNESLSDRIEDHHVSMSSDSAPSQVLESNSRYMSFNNGPANGENIVRGKRKANGQNNNNNVTSLSLGKSEIGIQQAVASMQREEQLIDKNADDTFFVKQETDSVVNNVVNIGNSSVVSNVTAALQQSIAYQHSQDMVIQLEVGKDKGETILSNENDLNRSSMAQIGEFLKLKTEVIEPMSSIEVENDDNSMQIAMCEVCDKELSSNEELAAHMVNCQMPSGSENDESTPNDKSNSVSCPICNKTFRRKEHLNQHQKLHSGERPYACNVCDKAFSRKEHLMRHSVSHTGLKCHPCEFCGKTFSRKDNLHKHKKTHGVAGPFVCEECGKSFVVKHYYIMHQAMHASPADEANLHKCDVCTKVFATKQYLNSHKLRHEKRKRQKELVEAVASVCEQPEQPEEHPTDQPELSTINAQAILPSNILQVPVTTTGAQPMFQVCDVTDTQTFVASVASKQLLETFKRLNSS